MIDRGGGDVVEPGAGELAVVFGAGDEVDPGLVFGFLEEAVVDDGAVPDEDDGTAFGGAGAEGVPTAALDCGDVVFLALKDRIAQIQMTDCLGAEVDEIG